MTNITDSQRAFEILVKEILKDFHCLVCRNSEFRLLDIFQRNLQTNINLYEGSNPVAIKRMPLISIVCTQCGHIEQFAQPALLERVSISEANSP